MKRLQLLLSVLSVLLVLAGLAAAWAWWLIKGSLPPLDGDRVVAGLAAPVKIERDALGVPTITGASRADVARATGFIHAQDRFFQMDLLRRNAAGELAEILGAGALPLDRNHRAHQFRRLAGNVVAHLTPSQHAVLDAYVAGVNAGLSALAKKPWEYYALRITPRPWTAEDSILVIYSMWLDQQSTSGALERNLFAVRTTLGISGLNFFAPLGNSWDAALDGSVIPPAPPPALRLRSGAAAPEKEAPGALPQAPLHPGSNSLAVTGARTANGAALLANDMHLNLSVPNLWYRAVLKWPESGGGIRRLVGVTLPGVPALVAGSNGQVAWGFTNAYVDTCDVVVVEPDAATDALYHTAHGLAEVDQRSDPIAVKGENPEPFKARWTEWGPIISGGREDGRLLALRWSAHDADATNLEALDLETAPNVAAALDIAHRAGLPNVNFLAADSSGAIGWTIAGKIPRRAGYDGRQPVSWAFGDRHWDGWLAAADTPTILNPPEGILWTANQRTVGGADLAKLGDGGYADGARAKQIRDDLRERLAAGKKVGAPDLFAIERDDRALFLDRWQKLLVTVLTDDAVAGNGQLREMRDWVRKWDGTASADSVAYRLVRQFRRHAAVRVLNPFFGKAEESRERFSFEQFHYEDALWQLVQERSDKFLNPAFHSWDAVLLAAANDVMADVEESGLPLARFTWGQHNTLRMQHPFSRLLPRFAQAWLDMPAEPLAGDSDMPLVQGRAFGASERMVVAPGHEDEGIFHMPGGQSGHFLSPYYRAGHEDWAHLNPAPLLPGKTEHTLTLQPN